MGPTRWTLQGLSGRKAGYLKEVGLVFINGGGLTGVEKIKDLDGDGGLGFEKIKDLKLVQHVEHVFQSGQISHSHSVTVSPKGLFGTSPIYFVNNPLEEVLSFKLLGLTICHDLSWESHISNLASKASRRLALEARFEMWLSQERSWQIVRPRSLKERTSSRGLLRKWMWGFSKRSFRRDIVRV